MEVITEGGEMSQRATQNSLSQSFTEDELAQIADTVVTYLLDVQYSMRPVNRQTLVKHVPKCQGRIFKDVMAVAKRKLLDVFGLELVEIQNIKTVKYMLTNTLTSKPLVNQLTVNTRTFKSNENTLLLLILCVIYKNGKRIKEGTLLEFLRKLDIIRDIEPAQITSEYFKGIELMKFIRNDLIETMYLESMTTDSADPDNNDKLYEYMWGERAEKEVHIDNLESFYRMVISGEDVVL